MSFFDDHEDEIIDGLRGLRNTAPRQDTKCNRCGSTDVRWRQQGGKWVMFSLQPGVLHQCPGRAASADEFEAV